MSHADVAKERMRTIAESINKSANPDIPKLIALSCIEWGTTPKTVKGYIKVLEDAGVIKCQKK